MQEIVSETLPLLLSPPLSLPPIINGECLICIDYHTIIIPTFSVLSTGRAGREYKVFRKEIEVGISKCRNLGVFKLEIKAIDVAGIFELKVGLGADHSHFFETECLEDVPDLSNGGSSGEWRNLDKS